MPLSVKLLKAILVYLFCTVVLLDVYIFYVKPYLEQSNIIKNIPIKDKVQPRHEPANSLRHSCFSEHGRLQSHACAHYFLETDNRHQSFTKQFRKSLVDATIFLWERFFLLFEEIETLTRSLILLSSTVSDNFAENVPVSIAKESSAISKFYDHSLISSNDRTANDQSESKQRYALTASIQKDILLKNVKIHASSQEDSFINITVTNMAKRPSISIDLRREANNTLKVAKEFMRHGNLLKAQKLLQHARQLDPNNAEVMAAYGEVFEQHKPPDYVQAEHYYGMSLLADPHNEKVLASRKRTLPLVEQIDQTRFNRIDRKVYQYYHIPEGHPGLRKLKKEHYFRYVYHTNAIEGNTLSLAQTRAILENRLAVGGKSILEHNEVLGLDCALKYLNSTLLRKQSAFTLHDILEIHHRVLGFVDLQEAGRLRNTQVFIADFTPPAPDIVPSLMTEFISWLNADDTQDLHPVELAALAHWKLVYIHPFYDGNGRTARLLMNLILMRAGYPPAIVRVEERALYYQLIREANEGDVRPFIRFIAHCTEATIDEFISTAKNVINFEGSVLQRQDGLAKPRVINL